MTTNDSVAIDAKRMTTNGSAAIDAKRMTPDGRMTSFNSSSRMKQLEITNCVCRTGKFGRRK